MAVVVGTGIERVVDAVGTSSKCWILVVAAVTLDSTIIARSGIMDDVDVVGTSNRRVIDAMHGERRRCHGDLQQQGGQVRYDMYFQ
jgi:hypothetical protein